MEDTESLNRILKPFRPKHHKNPHLSFREKFELSTQMLDLRAKQIARSYLKPSTRHHLLGGEPLSSKVPNSEKVFSVRGECGKRDEKLVKMLL